MSFKKLADASNSKREPTAKIYRNNHNMEFKILTTEETRAIVNNQTEELHEILERNRPTRLFLDVDATEPIDFSAIMGAMSDVLIETEHFISVDEFNISHYSTEDKHSAHIVLNVYVENLATAKAYMRDVKNKLTGNVRDSIDVLCGGSLRLIYTPKKGDKSRILKPYNDKPADFSEFLIQPEDMAEYRKISMTIPKIDPMNNDAVDIEETDSIIKIIERNFPHFKHRGDNFFDRTKPENCKSCNTKHHRENAVLYHSKDDVYMLYCCRSLSEFEHPAPLCVEFGKNYKTQSNDLTQSNSAQIFNSRYLSLDLFPSNKSLLIQSPYNSGKTYFYKQLIKTMGPKKTVLIITPRKTLTNSLVGDTEFVSYQDIKGELDIKQARRVIFQVDSLRRIPNETKFDLVIIDEVMTMASHIYAMNNDSEKRMESIANMQVLTKNARQLIVTDNNINDTLFNAFKLLKPDILFYRNEFKVWKDYKAHIITGSALAHDKSNKMIIDFITANTALKAQGLKYEKCSVAMHRARDAEALYDKIKDINPAVKLYTASGTKQCSDIEKLNDFKDVNTAWGAVDCVIYTSCVSVGVSCEMPEYTTCFAQFVSGNCGVLQSTQMLFRCRQTQNFIIAFSGSDNEFKEWNKKQIFKFCTVNKKHNDDYLIAELRDDKNITINVNTRDVPANLENVVNGSFGANLWLLATHERLQSSSFLGYLTNELKQLGMVITAEFVCSKDNTLEISTKKVAAEYAEFAIESIPHAEEMLHMSNGDDTLKSSKDKAGEHALRMANAFNLRPDEITKERFQHDEYNIDKKYRLTRFRNDAPRVSKTEITIGSELNMFNTIKCIMLNFEFTIATDEPQPINNELLRTPTAKIDEMVNIILKQYLTLYNNKHGARSLASYNTTKFKNVKPIIGIINTALDVIGFEIYNINKGKGRTALYYVKPIFYDNRA